jgi:hypothetical protein
MWASMIHGDGKPYNVSVVVLDMVAISEIISILFTHVICNACTIFI